MSLATLEATLKAIVPADSSLAPAVQAHLDDLTKPPRSLGRLEDYAMRYCLATGAVRPTLGRKRIYCFAGDHGVVAEGVSAYPKEVTPQMALNILAGGAAVCALSRNAGAELVVVDIGVDYDFGEVKGLVQRKIARGTANLAVGPAMSVAETRRALEVGIALAGEAQADGVTLLGTGEMGIGNTTPSTALYAAFLGCDVEAITGRGTGVDDAALKRKVGVIRRALDVNRARLTKPLDTLAALGGLEIAGICGLILGGAARRLPVVVDGFISSAAALAALRLAPAVKDYLFFSHVSQEQGHRHVLGLFADAPVLDLGMRLGEGTGAALAMMVIEGALKVYNEMATFSSAGVSGKNA